MSLIPDHLILKNGLTQADILQLPNGNLAVSTTNVLQLSGGAGTEVNVLLSVAGNDLNDNPIKYSFPDVNIAMPEQDQIISFNSDGTSQFISNGGGGNPNAILNTAYPTTATAGSLVVMNGGDSVSSSPSSLLTADANNLNLTVAGNATLNLINSNVSNSFGYLTYGNDGTLIISSQDNNVGSENRIDIGKVNTVINTSQTAGNIELNAGGNISLGTSNGVVVNSSTGLKLQSLTNVNNYQLPTPDTQPQQNQIITFNSDGTSQFINQAAPLTSSIFNYKASTPSYGIPASGFIEWAEPFQITPLITQIRVSHLNQDGQDIDTLLSLLQINDTILIQDKNNSENYQKWIIQNTPVVVPNSYIEFSVGQMMGGYQFSNNHAIVLITSTGSSILALQNQVQTNTFDISVLTTDVATNTTNIATNTADIITNAGAISILQLQQITDSGNISTLQQQISTNVLLPATVSTLSTGNAWNTIFIIPLVANETYFINSLLFYNCTTATNGLDFQLAFSNSTPLSGNLNIKAVLQIDNNTSAIRTYILTTTNSNILSFTGINTNAPAGQILSIDLIGQVLSTVSQNMTFQFRRTNTGNAAVLSVFKNSYYNILHNV